MMSELPKGFAENNLGLKVAIRTDGPMVCAYMHKLTDLPIDTASKLLVGSVVLTATSNLNVLIGEIKQEGIRTKGLIALATRGKL